MQYNIVTASKWRYHAEMYPKNYHKHVYRKFVEFNGSLMTEIEAGVISKT